MVLKIMLQVASLFCFKANCCFSNSFYCWDAQLLCIWYIFFFGGALTKKQNAMVQILLNQAWMFLVHNLVFDGNKLHFLLLQNNSYVFSLIVVPDTPFAIDLNRTLKSHRTYLNRTILWFDWKNFLELPSLVLTGSNRNFARFAIGPIQVCLSCVSIQPGYMHLLKLVKF